jgi:hypothetical protein
MTTIAHLTDTALKQGTPRSPEYRRGIEDVLRLKFGGHPIRCPFQPGTAQFDAYFSGNDRGHAIYRAEVQRRAELEEAARTRVFFADADAL